MSSWQHCVNHPELIFNIIADMIEKEMRKLFSIPDEKETRLWNRYMSNTFEPLNKPDSTIQDAGLYQGQVWTFSLCSEILTEWEAFLRVHFSQKVPGEISEICQMCQKLAYCVDHHHHHMKAVPLICCWSNQINPELEFSVSPWQVWLGEAWQVYWEMPKYAWWLVLAFY